MQNRLYRSRKHRMLFGVCGGIAEHFNVDPTIVRLAAAMMVMFDGLGLFIYIALAVLLPADATQDKKQDGASVEQIVDNLERTVEDVASRVEEHIERVTHDSSRLVRQRHSPWVGIALIFGGLLLLARNLGLVNRLRWNISWAFRPHLGFIVPVGLVIIGVVLVVLAERRKRRE